MVETYWSWLIVVDNGLEQPRINGDQTETGWYFLAHGKSSCKQSTTCLPWLMIHLQKMVVHWFQEISQHMTLVRELSCPNQSSTLWPTNPLFVPSNRASRGTAITQNKPECGVGQPPIWEYTTIKWAKLPPPKKTWFTMALHAWSSHPSKLPERVDATELRRGYAVEACPTDNDGPPGYQLVNKLHKYGYIYQLSCLICDIWLPE